MTSLNPICSRTRRIGAAFEREALPVHEVGAVGVPDPVSGEAVKVIVVRRDPSLTEAELRTHCRKYLTGYKVPHVIEFRDELPKTGLGKILRRALRD